MTAKFRFSRDHLFFIIVHIMLLIFLILFAYLTWDINSILRMDKWSRIVIKLVIITFIIQLISLKIKKIKYTDFRLWFLGFSYLFMYGRVLLNAINLDSNILWNLMVRHSIINLYHTSLIILCCIQSLFIGFFLFEDKREIISRHKIICNEPSDNLIYNVGKLTLLLSIPFRLYTDIYIIIQTQLSNSYSALSIRSGIADDLAFLAVPSIIYIISSGKLKRRNAFFIVIMSMFYFLVVMILTGDRRYQATAILSIILCYIKIYNIKFNKKRILFWGIGGFWLLNLFSVIRNIRHNDLTSLSRFFSIYWQDILFGKSTIYETLAEFGLSFFSVVHIYEYIPTYINFQYGYTFLVAIFSVLPIGWIFGDIFSNASISGMANKLAGATVGASLIGDLYGNFGWTSIVVGIICGMIIYKIFKISNKKNIRLSYAQYYSLFYILINLVRATIIEIFRPAIIVYYVPIIIMSLIKNINSKSKLRS